LAAVLLLAVILFVSLVLVPQLLQPQPAPPSVQAPVAVSVNASDLIGIWVPDAEAAWELTRITPLVAKRLAGLTRDAVARAKARFLAGVTVASLQYTADKIITTGPGMRREDIYKISAIDDNVFTIDSIDAKGKTTSQSKVTVAHDRLEGYETDKPDVVFVFNRAR
jgi:hypothetical protein